jgi:hypothetical protein
VATLVEEGDEEVAGKIEAGLALDQIAVDEGG